MHAPARLPVGQGPPGCPRFPVRAFLCALVAARFWGDPRPILHTGQLRAVDPPLMETVLGGESMAAPSQTLALPWFARSDYPALLDLFSDANKLPTTYDAWLERAERIEREFQKAGFGGFQLFPVHFVFHDCLATMISPPSTAGRRYPCAG